MNNPHRHKKLRETPEIVMMLWDYSKKLEERTDTFLANVMKLKTDFILAAGENSHKGETIAFKSDKNGNIKDWKKESIFVNIGLDEAAKMLSQRFEVTP